MKRRFWFPGLLLIFAWLLPLHVPPWVSWHNEFSASATLLVLCGVALFLSPAAAAGIRLPTTPWPLLLLAGIALVQAVQGVIAFWGNFWSFLSYAVLAVMACALGYAAAQPSTSLQKLAKPADAPGFALSVLAGLLLTVGLANLWVGFSQTLQLWGASEWVARTVYQTRASGNLAQPNHAALLFVMGVASAVYLAQIGRIGQWLAGTVAVLLTIGLCTTQSRSGMVGLAALTVWWLYGQRKGPAWRALLQAGGFASAAVAAFVAWPSFIAMYWVADGSFDREMTSNGRLELWAQLFDAVLMHPWVGWGVLQVARAQNATADAYPSVLASTYSHNLLLDIALWVGLPALCGIVFMVIIWSRRRLKLIRTPPAWYCVALALPLIVQSMTEFPYAYTYFLLPVFFALGALDALLGIEPRWQVRVSWARAGFVAAAAAFAWSAVEYLRIEEDFRFARFEALRVGMTPPGYVQPAVLLLTQLDALLRGTRIQPTPAMPREDIELLRNVAMQYPWAPTKFRYLAALALNGELHEARRQLKLVQVMHGSGAYAGVQQRLNEMSEVYPALRELSTR